jgi:hypothetical protein
MTAWGEYLDAARRLDAVRRATAATVAEETAAAQAARAELTTVRARLHAQRDALADAAHRAGLPRPDADPAPAEVASAVNALRPPPAGGVPAAALAGIRHARSTLDSADAELATADRAGPVLGRLRGWPPPVRNLLVYGPLAAVVLVLQLVLFIAVSRSSPSLYLPLCGLALPVLAFGIGWFTVGLLYPADAGTKVDRTPAVGAAVCLAPMLLACVGFGALAILR